MTLSALNAPEGDVDIEGLGDSNTHKKLDFDSGVTLVECCDVSIFECISRYMVILKQHLDIVNI